MYRQADRMVIEEQALFIPVSYDHNQAVMANQTVDNKYSIFTVWHSHENQNYHKRPLRKSHLLLT